MKRAAKTIVTVLWVSAICLAVLLLAAPDLRKQWFEKLGLESSGQWVKLQEIRGTGSGASSAFAIPVGDWQLQFSKSDSSPTRIYVFRLIDGQVNPDQFAARFDVGVIRHQGFAVNSSPGEFVVEVVAADSLKWNIVVQYTSPKRTLFGDWRGH